MPRPALIVALVAVAALCSPALAIESRRALRRRGPEPGLSPEVADKVAEAATGGEYVEDFPHDKSFKDHSDRIIPSHDDMMQVASDVKEKETQDVKVRPLSLSSARSRALRRPTPHPRRRRRAARPPQTMLHQLEVLQNYLTKLSVRHEFLMEKYHEVLEGGQDRKLRRMVAEIVGAELKQREAKRENMVREIVLNVVNILKGELGLGANAEEATEASDEQLQQEAVQEAVQEALEDRGAGGDDEQADESVGGTDRVLEDVNEGGISGEAADIMEEQESQGDAQDQY